MALSPSEGEREFASCAYPPFGGLLINTRLQPGDPGRGEGKPFQRFSVREPNRYHGSATVPAANTPLKRGVNEKIRDHAECIPDGLGRTIQAQRGQLRGAPIANRDGPPSLCSAWLVIVIVTARIG